MKHKKSEPPTLNAAELQLIEQLRQHPELFERVRSILEITASAEGTIKKADQIEALLIEEMRRLGHTTMETWAGKAEQTLSAELKQKDASAKLRKKNAELVVRIRAGEGDRTSLAHGAEELPALAATGHWCDPARSIPTLGTRVDRFWH